MFINIETDPRLALYKSPLVRLRFGCPSLSALRVPRGSEPLVTAIAQVTAEADGRQLHLLILHWALLTLFLACASRIRNGALSSLCTAYSLMEHSHSSNLRGGWLRPSIPMVQTWLRLQKMNKMRMRIPRGPWQNCRSRSTSIGGDWSKMNCLSCQAIPFQMRWQPSFRQCSAILLRSPCTSFSH